MIGLEEFDTSLPMNSWYYHKLKNGEKTIEMRNERHGIEAGDKVRFMHGYDPENGHVIKEVKSVESKATDFVTDEEIEKLGLENRDQLEDYATNGYVVLFYLKEGST